MENRNNMVPPLRRSAELTKEMHVECSERWVSQCYLPSAILAHYKNYIEEEIANGSGSLR